MIHYHGGPVTPMTALYVAQNHNRAQNTPRKMADRWDAMQTPARWVPRMKQAELFHA